MTENKNHEERSMPKQHPVEMMLDMPPVRYTDDKGRPVGSRLTEPPEGSVFLTHGPTGTAYQRFFSDGLYHSVAGGGGLTFADLLKQSRLTLVYRAPEEN